MRVAIVISRLDRYGPVVIIKNLVNALKSVDDLKFTVFYLEGAPDPELMQGISTEKLDRRNFNFDQYDIIHTHGIRPDLYAFLHRKKIKYHISTIHNFVFEDLRFRYIRIVSWIFGNIWLILWRRADKLVCVSNSLKSYYLKWLPDSKLEVICNGISDADNSVPVDHKVIEVIERFHGKGLRVAGFTGNLSAIKGIDLLLPLIDREKGIGLVIIGDGSEMQELIRLSKIYQIEERCVFCGYLTNAGACLKHFDLFIMPSRSEGFGLAMLEAVQQKIPVICSDIVVFRELFKNDEVTFFNLEDAESFSIALKTAITEGNHKTEMAYKHYIENYTADTMAKHYRDIYLMAGNINLS